jgi:hypothetical protein
MSKNKNLATLAGFGLGVSAVLSGVAVESLGVRNSCELRQSPADISGCDDFGPAPHGRTIFVQVITSTVTGTLGGSYAPAAQYIDAEDAATFDQRLPVATEPATPVTLFVEVEADIEFARWLFGW